MTSSAQVKNLLGEVDQILDRRHTEQRENVGKLLDEAHRILKLQKKYEKLRGEKFNVFSILGAERRELKHSAFIGELLNPKGTHLKKETFLKLFLDTVGFKKIEGKKLKAAHASVEIEKPIGKVGRIDIYIKDKKENSVLIENKICAIDQTTQIQRYCAYNEGKNTVYYLTFYGGDPSSDSKGTLKAGENYFNISYREHIIPWLEACLKESVDQPILRETIKQYLVLIKRLTFTMNDEHEKQLHDLLLKNYNTANYIAENFPQIKQNFCEELCEEVIEKLKYKNDDRYIIREQMGGKIFIQIKLEDHEEKQPSFRVGPFHNTQEELFFGIYDSGEDKNDVGEDNIYKEILYKFEDKSYWRNEQYWPKFRYFLSPFDGKNYSVVNLLPKLHANEDNKNKFIEHIVSEVQKYISHETA